MAEQVELDEQGFLLPAVAWVDSASKIVIPARRSALDKSREEFELALSEQGETSMTTHLALGSLIQSAMAIGEAVGVWGDSIVNPYPGTSMLARATHYRARHVNTFFATIHKKDDEVFLTIAGLSMGGDPVCDLFDFEPPITQESRDVFLEAMHLTARTLRSEFVDLAKAWDISKPAYNASRHAGRIMAPDSILRSVSAGPEKFAVWRRSKRGNISVEVIDQPLSVAAEAAFRAGTRAAEILDHVVSIRSAVTAQFDLASGHALIDSAQNFQPSWRFWLNPADLNPGSKETLKKVFGVEVLT